MFYVYDHIDPETKELLYVGLGRRERAWVCGSSTSRFRNKDYSEYQIQLLEKGFIPSDWVNIVHRGLSREEAFAAESARIKALKPRFNIPQSVAQLPVTIPTEVQEQIYELRKQGLSNKEISLKTGKSVMSIIKYAKGALPRYSKAKGL